MRTVKEMRQFERVCATLKTADEGFFVRNEDNGREVEVTNMTGGRYLCTENGEVCRQTDSEAVAYKFLEARNDMYIARIVKRDRRCVTGYRTVSKYFENFDAAVRWARASKPQKFFIHEGLNSFIPDNIIYEEEC